MAEIVVGLLGPLTEIAPFIKRQFNYFCCFDSNINSLDEEAKELDDARAALQQKIDEAENGARVIYSKVLSWMKKVDEIQQQKRELDAEITKIREGGYLSLKSRYSVSREAANTAEAMKQTRLEDPSADMTDISHPLPPASTVPDCLQTPTTEFESRKEIEKDLIALLKETQVNMLGLWGMGGVGKTTLANKIKNKMMEENVFGESVMTVVSESPNIEKIQEDIAGQLGITRFDDNVKSLSSRARILHNRLKCKKRILIILDDVWGYLDLNKLGIPCESGPEGCTILLTSRKKNVLGEMKVLKENVLEMQTLSEEEAFFFFQEQLGTSADNQSRFHSLAQQIANECKGLPLALAIVARNLKFQMDINDWEDALEGLRRSSPEDLQDVIKGVYNSIKVSYDNLTSNAQSIFLLCSLFPEDFNIPLGDLTAYAMGLRMFKGIEDLKTIKTKTYSLVNMLKSCALLLAGRDERYVRMHDIVRDVAIFIASDNTNEMSLIRSGYNSTWISLFDGGERIEFSDESIFPNLHLLLIDKSATGELQNSGISFEGMKNLNVLSIRNVWSLTSLPLTTQYLRTLVLVNCESLKTISFRNCNSIFCSCEISVDSFTHLQDLRLDGLPKLKTFCNSALWLPQLLKLEISYCHEMRSFNLVSLNVDNLEDLHIWNCRMMENVFLWSEEENERTITFPKLTNLALRFLPRLTTFSKGVESIEFPLLTHMRIDNCPNLTNLVSTDMNTVNEQTVYYSLPIWDQQNFTSLEELYITENHEISCLFSSSAAINLINLKHLWVESCKNMVKVIEEEAEEYSHETLFPHLEELCLVRLPKLKFFCGWRCALNLPLLEEVVISSDCDNVSSFSLGSLTTPNLKTVRIEKDDVITNTQGIIDLNNVLQQRFNREKSTSRKEEISISRDEEGETGRRFIY